MYGDVVFDLGKELFEQELEKAKARRKVKRDIDLPADDLHDLVHDFKTIVKKKTGRPFPDDPQEQLWGAIEAVFQSWNTRRAKDYRQVHGIPDDLGTAVNIVARVDGKMGDDCGTGVAFTRDCRTGENVLNGDVLTNAQGEDVVSGARTPEPIEKMKRSKGGLSKIYKELERLATKLERHFKDVQDVEFTFEHGELYMLQTRRAQRTGIAAVRVAVEVGDDGLVTGKFRVNGRAVKRGQIITVDGTTGRVILGAAKLVTPKVGKEFDRLMAWADAKRRLRVRANADIPADARRAREFGAEGIGLCRTEHMFFEGDRITLMREMIVAADEAGRSKEIAQLLQ